MLKSVKYRLYHPRQNKENNPDGHKVAKHLLQIPLLPPKKIREGVDFIKKLINELFNSPEKQKSLKAWLKFMNNYFEVQWMKTTTLERFSVYWEVDRTNNYSETNNSVINQDINSKPESYTFICE